VSLSKEVLEGTYEGVQKLLVHGAPVNIIDEYGFTPLINATIRNRFDLAQLLVKNGANVNLVDIGGSTALLWAIDNNNFEIAELLLKNGASANTYNTLGQPVLFYPLLRKNNALIKLLLDHGANIDYAKDFISTKLIGHRFELKGSSDVVTPEGLFLSIDLEGFYLEFTLELIRESLTRFINSYVAHRMDIHESELKRIIYSFENASKLREYKHITKDIESNKDKIFALTNTDLLLLPVSYKGHAITFIKHGDFLGKCDRGVHKMTDPIVIHTVGKPEVLNEDFYLHLLYDKHSERYMKLDIYKQLDLHPQAKLPIKHQITGNCSWANVESSVPTMLYTLLYDKVADKSKVDALVSEIMHFYKTWLEWDKDRAIEDCLVDFDKISFQRQKAKASLLGAVLFQACSSNNPYDINRARKILGVLSRKEFHYIVRIYINVFARGQKSSKGRDFLQVIERSGYKPNDFIY
jgi:hypothetical protein